MTVAPVAIAQYNRPVTFGAARDFPPAFVRAGCTASSNLQHLPLAAFLHPIEGQRQKNIRIYESEAVDTGPMGLPVINQPVLAAVDKQARSQLRTLSMYVGMSALLTINAVRLAAARDLRVHPDSCLWRQPSSACFGSQKGEGEHQGAFGKKSQKCSAILCMGWEFLIGQVQENEGELS